MQRLEAKPTQGRLLILDQSGLVLHHSAEGRGDRLGPLEKSILPLLFEEPLHAAEIAKRLRLWHNHVHVSLEKLARKVS